MKDIYRMGYYELVKYHKELSAEQCFDLFDKFRACNFGINIDIEIAKAKLDGISHFCVTMIFEKYKVMYEKEQKSIWLYLPFSVMQTMIEICDEYSIKYEVAVSGEYKK